MKILACYDNGGETIDRYTVVFDSYHDRQKTMRECLALSTNPNSPPRIFSILFLSNGPTSWKEARVWAIACERTKAR